MDDLVKKANKNDCILLEKIEAYSSVSDSNYEYKNWVFYRTESRVRRVWLVIIVYDIPNRFDKDFNPNDERFSYFIDVTTGEVIGGGSIF